MSNSTTSTPSDEQISVLIVDDSAVDRQMMVFACAKLNAEAEMAANGAEAIELFLNRNGTVCSLRTI